MFIQSQRNVQHHPASWHLSCHDEDAIYCCWGRELHRPSLRLQFGWAAYTTASVDHMNSVIIPILSVDHLNVVVLITHLVGCSGLAPKRESAPLQSSPP
jgi:hypothetical protein